MPYPYYNSYQMAPQYYQQSSQNSNSLVWVQGESGAKSFLIAPNTTVLLMDSEANKFYLKSADSSGVPLPLRKFTYSEDSSDAQNDILKQKEDSSAAYDAKGEIEALKNEIATLKENVKKMMGRKSDE